jgi:DNA ligase-1
VARTAGIEREFLRKLLYGELRQGALEGVLLEAVAKAADVSAERMRRAVMLVGNLREAARTAILGGGSALEALGIRLMQPVKPMLADSAEDVASALAEIPDAALEYKLDGARVQVHKDGSDVRVYSRTLNDVTASVPEVVSLIRALPTKNGIFDGEVLALKPDGTPHAFQDTMRRFGRTRGVDREAAGLPLTPFLFDCLFLDDTALVDEPQERRVQAMRDVAGGLVVPQVVRPSRAEAEAFTTRALGLGHEGVMVKSLEAAYAAGRRGSAWLKVKQARTLDLVVLAVEWGSGRRQGYLSNIHLGARDRAANGFVMLGKTFKGMTDAMLAWQTEHFPSLEIGRDANTVYVRPETVVEIAFNEVQRSAVYPGGVALRFARVKRYRLDKKASEADTIDTVRALAPRLG